MPSTLILDTTDEEVASIVSQWEQGGRYYITMEITQMDPSDSGQVRFEVDTITDHGPADVEEVAPPEEGPMGKAGTGAMGSTNMGMAEMMGKAGRKMSGG
jgi:hypothetical protein